MAELNLFGQRYNLSQEIINDLKLKHFFKNLSVKAMSEFKPLYDDEIQSWKCLYDYGHELWFKGIQYISDIIIKYFSDYDIYDITDEVLSSGILENSLYMQILDEYCDLIEEIEADQKGAMKAGAMNMVTGAAHDIANAAGKGISSAEASSKRNNIFLQYKDKFPIALKYDIEEILFSFVEERLISKNAYPLRSISDDAKSEAKRIFENLKKLNNDDSVQYKMAYKLLCADPSNIEYYIYLVDRFPNEKSNILEAANLAFIDTKDILKNELQWIINKYPCDSEENAKILKTKLIEFMNEYNISDIDYLDEVNEYLKQKDIEARTFNNVLYETREQKQKACSDFEELNSKCAHLEYKNEKQCRDLKNDILHSDYTPQVRDEFIKKIDDRIDQIWASEDRVILNSLLIELQLGDEQKKKECIEYIIEKGRTQEKQKYIDAIEALTPENIKKAKEYLQHQRTSKFKLYIWNWISIIPVIICWNAKWWLGIIAGFIALTFLGGAMNKYEEEKKMWDLLTIGGIAVHPAIR